MAVESGELLRQNAALALLENLSCKANNDVFHSMKYQSPTVFHDLSCFIFKTQLEKWMPQLVSFFLGLVLTCGLRPNMFATQFLVNAKNFSILLLYMEHRTEVRTPASCKKLNDIITVSQRERKQFKIGVCILKSYMRVPGRLLEFFFLKQLCYDENLNLSCFKINL